MSSEGGNQWHSIIIILILVGALIAFPGFVKAEIYDVGAGRTFQLSNYVSEGDVITWDWHTTDMSEGFDFWVESPTGARYSYRTDIQSWTGSFTVTSTGTWYLKWYNDNLFYTVTVEYDVSTYTPYTGGGGDDYSFDWTPIILLLILVIIVIVAIAGIASLAGKKKQITSAPQPPPSSRYAQSPQQLQQKHCPYCGTDNPSDYNFCGQCKQSLPEVKI